MEEIDYKECIIRFLKEENLSHEIKTEPELDFIINFKYPPKINTEEQIQEKTFVIYKPTGKNYLIMSFAVQFSKEHVILLNSISEEAKMIYFLELRKYFLLKDVFYAISSKEMRYEINEKLYWQTGDQHSLKIKLQKCIKKIYNCYIFSNVLFTEMFLSSEDQQEIKKAKDFSSGLDYSLYI
ncbi:MAG: hypothetical protein ACTSXH_19040 [Promethearchaeota archaeon]